MKFVQLKGSLKSGIARAYVVFGDDSYLINNAVQLLKKAVGLTMPEVNMVVYGESKLEISKVLQDCSSMPFFDEKRLVLIKDFSPADSKKDIEKIKQFIQANEQNVFIFEYSSITEFCKKLQTVVEPVDCSKLDPANLKSWILNSLKSSGIGIMEDALDLLIDYCGGDLTKISVEVSKLKVVGVPVITKSEVVEYVTPDKEYQVFELAENLAVGNREKVFDIVEVLFGSGKNAVGLIQIIYGSFRRLLYIALSFQKSDEELGRLLGVKPYAIKKAREQAKKFSVKQLKKITQELSNLEYMIKCGKFNQDIAIIYSICNILLLKEK